MPSFQAGRNFRFREISALPFSVKTRVLVKSDMAFFLQPQHPVLLFLYEAADADHMCPQIKHSKSSFELTSL
jgi:hypothetical protein